VPYNRAMDTRGFVLKAIEALRWASDKDIMRYLDEEGEALSRHELTRALAALIDQGLIERRGDLYRLKKKAGSKTAFDALFGDG